jgi:hypothetical protein
LYEPSAVLTRASASKWSVRRSTCPSKTAFISARRPDAGAR